MKLEAARLFVIATAAWMWLVPTGVSAQDRTEVFPLYPAEPKVNTNYGAYGVDDGTPKTYVGDKKTHIGTDYDSKAGATVLSPVDGKIVYYEGSTNPEKNVVIIRDAYGNDHILGHMTCDACKGKTSPFDPSKGIEVRAGQAIGSVMDFGPTGKSGDHLHYGVVVNPGIVANNGSRRFGWGLISDKTNEEALKLAKQRGFVDMNIDQWVRFVPPAIVGLMGPNSDVVCMSSQNLSANMGSPLCGSEWVRKNQNRDLRTRQVDPRGNF